MHIVMLSDVETRGGAAVSASRLAGALCREQHRVTRIVARRDGVDHPWVTAELWPSLLRWGLRHIMPGDSWKKFNASSLSRQLDAMLDKLQPDVINIHNLHEMIWAGWSLDLVGVCLEHAPTVWTLHDMWSFTGRCAYDYDCGKFLTGCDASCPTAAEYPVLAPERIASAWQQRKRLFDAAPRLLAITPSAWLRFQAESGIWRGHRIALIPNGLPLDVYCPMDREQARSKLGLQRAGPVILMAANNLSERRKGGPLFIEALRHLSRRPLTVITVGAGELDCHFEGIEVHPLGFLTDEQSLAMAYNAADLTVHAAPFDNLPNTVMESIACGTPAVGFPIGGMPDMVRPGQTGWLVKDVSGRDLALAIDDALVQIAAGVNLRATCRTVAEAEYGADLQAQRYLAVFQSLRRLA